MKRSNTQSGFNFILGRIEMCLGFGHVPFFGLERSSTRLNDAFIGSAKKKPPPGRGRGPVDPSGELSNAATDNGEPGGIDFPSESQSTFPSRNRSDSLRPPWAQAECFSVVERVATAWKLACIYTYTDLCIHMCIYPYILYTSI
jgi:hypothetical protein